MTANVDTLARMKRADGERWVTAAQHRTARIGCNAEGPGREAGTVSALVEAPRMSTTERAFQVTGIDMNGYMVKDTGRALAFYRDVLGLEPTTIYPEGRGAEFEFGDGSTFGLWNPGDTMPFQAGSGVMFAVDDFDAAVRHAKERGSAVFMEHETPVCFMAAVEDSEGNRFIMHRRKIT